MDGFVFYRSFGDALRGVPADEYKAIMTAVIDYALDGVEPELSSLGQIVFTLIRPQIDANAKRREAGKRGGRPKKADEKPMVSELKTNGFEDENRRLSTEKPKVKVKDKVKDKEKDKEKLKDKVKDKVNEGAEQAPRDVVIALPLNDGTLFHIDEKMVDKWKGLYPAVDIMQELRKMAGWLDGNATRRKTRAGILRFVNAWLAKEQDRSRGRAPARTAAPVTRFHNFDGRADDDDDMALEAMRQMLKEG